MSENSQRSEELHDIRDLMKTKNGRSFIFRCLQHCGTYVNVFDKDPFVHAHSSGMRAHGVWLEREVKEAADESFLIMLRENNDG